VAANRLAVVRAEENVAADLVRELEANAYRVELAQAIAHVRGLPARVLPMIDELAQLREQAVSIRKRIEDEVDVTQQIYRGGAGVAGRLGMSLEHQLDQPTLTVVHELVRVGLLLADQRAGRPADVTQWLEPEPVPRWDAANRDQFNLVVATIKRLRGDTP
jgi:hypothetical protein